MSDHSSRYTTSGLTSSSSSIKSYTYNEEPIVPATSAPGSVTSLNITGEIRNRHLMTNENIQILRDSLSKYQANGYNMYLPDDDSLSEISENSMTRSQLQSRPMNRSTESLTNRGSSPTTPRVLRSSHQLSRAQSAPKFTGSLNVSSGFVAETSVINAEKQKEIINLTMKISTDCFKTISYILNTSEQSSDSYGQLTICKEQLELLQASLLTSTKELENLQKVSEEIGPELGEPRDWNEEYQQCLKLPQDNAGLRAKRFKAIATVAQNFEHAAQTYGRIIVSEVFVPAKYRTIKPFMNLGGNAGGEKYIYNGILFKFATDWKGIYGGDHEAMKAASHEMLSLMTVQNCDMEDICTPLMTLIDYLGFRLIAMSLLPVKDSTLIYGSSDGGRNVHADDPEVNKVMDQLAKKLNLAPHVAGMTVEDSKTIGFPVDVEGHRGEDGRFYLLDLARLMPPTQPIASLRSCFLYRLFRPEFTRQYHRALSSDAHSPRFDMCDPNRFEHQNTVNVATEYLLNSCIPKIATVIQRQLPETTSAFEVTNFLRAHGVNTRYLAVVRKHMQSVYFKQLLLIEMVARGIKNYLRELLRETKRSKKVLSQEPYREVLIDTFNKLLGNFQYAPQTIDLWNEIHRRLLVYFPGFPSHSELVAEAPTPAIQAGFAIINHVCPAVLVGDKQVSIAIHECYTCGLMGGQGVCSVCAEECHAKKGHSVSRSAQMNRGVAYCDCKQQDSNCTCVSNTISTTLDETKLGEMVQCPLRYMINATGIHRVLLRVQEMTGIRFSETALEDLKDHRREFVFVSPDIASLQPRIKKLPIVSVAEAQALRLTAEMLSQPQERYRLYQQSRELLRESLLINPGSEALLNMYAGVCVEMAHNIEDTAYASQLIDKTLRVYRALKNRDAVKILVVDMIASKRPFAPSVFQLCFEIILSQAHGNVTAKDVQFIAEYGDGIESLNFDGSSILDDSLLLTLAPKCQNVTSLRLGYCYKVTSKGISQILNVCGPVLRELILDGTQHLPDDLIRALPKKCPNLVHLSLVAVPLSPELARQVPWLRKLTCLNLNFTAIDTPLYSPTLRVLRLHKSLVSLSTVKYMIRWSPLLKHIDISWCEKITNGAPLLLSVLKYTKQMKIVSLDGIKLHFDAALVKNIKAVQGPRPTLCINSVVEDEHTLLRDCGFTLQIGRERSGTSTSSKHNSL